MGDGERTEANVLDNAPIQLVLGGEMYPFSEPSNRARRELLAQANEVLEEYPEFQRVSVATARALAALPANATDADKEAASASVVVEAKASQLFRAVNRALDFLCVAVPSITKDQKRIEDESTSGEIMTAYSELIGLLSDPSKSEPSPAAASAESSSSPSGSPSTSST